MLLTVYQSYHGIFNKLGNINKANYYISQMYKIVVEEKKGTSYIKDRVMYYLCTNAFDECNLELAKEMVNELVEKDPIKFKNLLLIYLYLCGKGKDDKKKYIEIFERNNERCKVEAKYFSKKFRGVSKNRLKEYIVNKIFVILQKEHTFEYRVFLDELYHLGYHEDYYKFWNLYKERGYKLPECWRR